MQYVGGGVELCRGEVGDGGGGGGFDLTNLNFETLQFPSSHIILNPN